MRSRSILICCLLAAILFLSTTTTFGKGFLDSLGDTLSEAGEAISETGGKIADSAKKAGEDMGLIDKQPPAKKETPATAAKLPAGVSKRLKDAERELDKAEASLAKGSGSVIDRGKRAEASYGWAEGHMQEIEQKYAGQYSPAHPDILAVNDRMEKVRARIDAALAGTLPASGASAASSGQEVASATPSNVAADTPLPGGVSSRIKNMYKELDKVDSKLSKGAGSSVDRANRAALDLQRAQKYMEEIKTRYQGQYSPEHPDMVAAVARLEATTMAHQVALGKATAEQAEANRLAQEQRQKEEAEQQAAEAERKQQEDADKQSRQAREELCSTWLDTLEPYAYGDKHFSAYQTSDTALLAGWKANYDAARSAEQRFRAEVAAGECAQAESVANLLLEKMSQFDAVYQQAMDQLAETARDKGQILFSTTPFGQTGGGQGQAGFQAGDHIYGLIQVVKPWSEIYGGKDKCQIRVDVTIDGKKIHAQFVNLKSDSYAAADRLIFDVAPAPEKMTAYSDPNIEYGKSTATIIQGPNELTDKLAGLDPGSHSLNFSIQYYGKTWAEGGFTIEGNDFSYYRELHGKIAGGVVAARTLPAAKMENKGMQEEMISLLIKAGWPNVYRLNIVDKDWWIERVSGGDSPVKARYMAAVALTEAPDGKYYYKHCTFHQDKLITGAFGQLYLSHQGEAVEIPKENRDK